MVPLSWGGENRGSPGEREVSAATSVWCLHYILLQLTLGCRRRHFCRVRKWSSTRLPDITPKSGIIAPQLARLKPPNNAYTLRRFLILFLTVSLPLTPSSSLAFVPSYSSVSILVPVAPYPDLSCSLLDEGPVSVWGGGMCLFGRRSEKAIKWTRNTRPRVSEMKVLHLRRGTRAYGFSLYLTLQHTLGLLNNSRDRPELATHQRQKRLLKVLLCVENGTKWNKSCKIFNRGPRGKDRYAVLLSPCTDSVLKGL